jgi:hypothetical protein
VVRSQAGQIVPQTLSGKKSITKKNVGGVIQVMECLLSKGKALSSNPSTTKKPNKKPKKPKST